MIHIANPALIGKLTVVGLEGVPYLDYMTKQWSNMTVNGYAMLRSRRARALRMSWTISLIVSQKEAVL